MTPYSPVLTLPIAIALRLGSFRMRMSSRQHRTHLEDGDHRQESAETAQQEDEQSDRAELHAPVPARAVVHAPPRWQEAAAPRRRDDDEAFQPHAVCA